MGTFVDVSVTEALELCTKSVIKPYNLFLKLVSFQYHPTACYYMYLYCRLVGGDFGHDCQTFKRALGKEYAMYCIW